MKTESVTGGIYRIGRHEFIDLDRAGGSLRALSTRRIKITERGVGFVERHLKRFGKWGHNDAMVKRLRRTVKRGNSPTQIELDFYAHELRESVRLKNLGNASGVVDRNSYLKAHNAALREYGIPCGEEERRLYTADAMRLIFFRD